MPDDKTKPGQNDQIPQQFLSIQEAARQLAISPRHLRNAIDSGKLKAYLFQANKRGTYRIARSDLDEYLGASVYQPVRPVTERKKSAGGRLFRELNSDRLLDAWQDNDGKPRRRDNGRSPSNG